MDELEAVNEQPERRRRRFSLVLIIGAIAASCAVVGFGGLAAWTVVTSNSGTATAVRIEHTNTVNGVTCTSNLDGSATVCQAIMNFTATSEGNVAVWDDTVPTPATAKPVVIQNTSSQSTTFTLGLTQAAPGATGPNYCADLTMTVTDGEATPATVYSGAATIAAFGAAKTVKDSAGNTSWPSSNSDTFHFKLVQGGTQAADNGGSCTLTVTWTQQ